MSVISYLTNDFVSIRPQMMQANQTNLKSEALEAPRIDLAIIRLAHFRNACMHHAAWIM